MEHQTRQKWKLTTVILTCPLGPCGWFTYSFTVHTLNTYTVLSVGKQVYMEMARYAYVRMAWHGALQKKTTHIGLSVRHFETGCLTLQHEGVGGSANINLFDVVVCGCGMVTDDKPRDVARCGDMRDCPCHPDVVRTHPSKLQVGGSWNSCKNEGLKVIANTWKRLIE